jgi:peptidoglycan/LPS O-acetylase OafA/YrhL
VSATVGLSEATAVRPVTSAARDLPNLDFMRALAVMLVVADHILETVGAYVGQAYSPLDWYLGRMGVLMFFVHTSLVLMLSMDRSRAGGLSFFTTFYLRRAFRIYPLSIVCVLLVLAIDAPPNAWTHERQPDFSTVDIVGNLLLIQNLVYADLVLNPLWSLPLELQMYLVLPIFYVLLRTASPVRRAFLFWVLAVVIGLVQPHVPGASRLNVAMYGPCFTAGVLAYTLLPRTAPRWPATGWAALLGGLSAAYVAIALASPVVHPPWLAWLFCLSIGVAIPQFVQFTHAGVCAAAHGIAKYSYGVYLFHMLALWVGLGPNTPWPLGPVGGSLVTLAVLVIAPVATFHLIEQPMIGVGTRLAKRLTTRAA